MTRILAAAGLALLVCGSSAHGAERMEVCAKYKPTGKQYKVEATVLDGGELNDATSSLKYNVFSKYVVIFWERDQASVIELDFGSVLAMGTDGKDQQGRRWEISSLTSVCW